MDLKLKGKKYLIFEITKSMTKDNRPYIKVILMDKDGKTYNGIMFDSNKLAFDPEKGNVVEVIANIQNYNGQPQFKINTMTLVEGENKFDFFPKTKFNINNMLEELKNQVLNNLTNIYLVKMVEEFFSDSEIIEKFKIIPAAKNVHHAYIGGLLEHTLSVVKLAVLVGDYYKEYVDKELLVIGALFHDIGKIFELTIDNAFDYSEEGKLLGHLLLGIELINKYEAKIDGFPKRLKHLINHMIASHHGILEFGSPKKPKTTEALLLHYIDDMDAKLNTFISIFSKENVEEGWSNYDRLLERQLFNHNSNF
ncbi:3'-5' exoribonuclease YhaM family protein [Deferribacter abyssi]|uniref:3'-5' exoribonuclease YhaM family protein n=1 Tax=Deferribacter abyssi TaxID=213806 RepID=UPI003C1F2FBD